MVIIDCQLNEILNRRYNLVFSFNVMQELLKSINNICKNQLDKLILSSVAYKQQS